ncbi:hypothetical protein QM012_006589 [Aureobasidium pullulans]|uniref:RING-type domain-containing protein n=1 Tax=Aureobasidium pullulans TaxID=5580 RepID=A0ABR0TP13_AURPU
MPRWLTYEQQFMDAPQPTQGVRRHHSRRRTLLTLRTIRSLFQRIQEGVRSRLHFPHPTTNHSNDASRDITHDLDLVVFGDPSHNLLNGLTHQPFAIGTFVMSSSRNTRRVTGQLRRPDESLLGHAVRRSRRVAGESPESGPYQPPPRRPSRQEAVRSVLPQPETVSHPPPPSSTFTFSRLDPPVPFPGFGSVGRPFTLTPPGPVQPSHINPSVQPSITDQVNPHQVPTMDAHLQGFSGMLPPAKVRDLTPHKANNIKRECDICCEADDAPVLQPCRLCQTSYCGDCIKGMFLEATHDSTMMPPRCCTILSTVVALNFLSTAEAEAYRLKFEEWVSTKKTYCPVPKCSRFIPDRAVLPPPSADPITLWTLLKQELPTILAKLQQEHCAQYFMDATSPAAHGIRDWKPPTKMVWLSELSTKISRYSNMAEFVIDFNRLYNGGRSMPPIASACAEILRRHFWKQVGRIKSRVNSKFTVLPAAACFSCPDCHIAICPSCKQVAHFGQPCDTTAQDHELAMLETYGYKQCPRCGHGVKRMYGCRHMQCRCGAHWCWGCLRPFDECDGGCDSPDSGSEDGHYSDQETEPDTPQPNVIPMRAQDGEQNAAFVAHTPAIGSTPAIISGNASSTATQPTTASAGAVRPGFTERPIDLDAGGRRVWEATNAFFGEEPDDGYHSTIWSCLHSLKPAQISDEAFKRGVPLSTECFRCFYRTYATVQKSVSGPSAKSQDSGENKHKHTVEEDVAWQCERCEMSLCGVCKNDVLSERDL